MTVRGMLAFPMFFLAQDGAVARGPAAVQLGFVLTVRTLSVSVKQHIK